MTIRASLRLIVFTLILSVMAFAQNGNGSGQDNSPGNGVTNSGSDNGQGNGGTNNGQHNGDPSGGGNGGGQGSGGNGGNGGSGGQGGNGGQGGSSSVTTSSSSTSTAVSGSQSTSTATGGNATATGGNSTSVSKGGNVSNSGNSSSKSGGNSLSTSYNQVHQAPAVFAPNAYPTAPCRVAASGGASWLTGGVSVGGSKKDDGCDTREFARSFFLAGSRLAGCKMLLTDKKVRKAGITLTDCMASESRPAAELIVPDPPKVEPVQITVQAPTIPAPQVTVLPAPVIVQPAAPATKPVQSVKPLVHKKVTGCATATTATVK